MGQSGLSNAIKKARKVHGEKYDYSLISEYKNNKTKYPIVCHELGSNGKEHGMFVMDFSHHVNRSQGCPMCKRERLHDAFTISNDEYVRKCIEIYGDEYNLQYVNYVNANTLVTIECKEHGKVEVNPRTFLKGNGCPLCRPKSFTIDDVRKKILSKYHGDIEYISAKYDGIDSIGEFYCKKHNITFKKKIYDAIHKNACQLCGKERQEKASINSKDEIINRCIKTHGDRYSYEQVGGELIKLKEKIPITCKKHGVFWQTPSNHIKGEGCPKCRESFGERVIEKALKCKNILFVQQKSFDFLNGKKGSRLSLDFYIPNKKIGIEFQGSQHFLPIGMFGYKDGLNERLERDWRKNKLCNEHGIEIYYIVKECDKKYTKEYDFYDSEHVFTDVEEFINKILNLDKDGNKQRSDMP